MIVVDSSALLAALLNEPLARACLEVLAREDARLISAGTLAETMLVSARRGRQSELDLLLRRFPLEVVPVTEATARAVAAAHSAWGRRVHPAALNFGDCFAYALAKERGCPLLYVGDDFARTDIVSAI